jgi:carboxyl-terminal processing protease
MDRFSRVVLTIAVAVILLMGGFAGGFVLARHGASVEGIVNVTSAESTVGDKVEEVMTLLEGDALKPPTETSATAGAIQGLLDATGDKYALYFDAQHYKYFNEQSAGAFGGIGVTIAENKNGQAYVVSVMADTPASKAGIKANDVFVTVDGVTRSKWTSEEIVKRVRGNPGTTVTVVMRRDKELKTFTVTRANIQVPNIESRILESGVGYIRLFSFNQRSEQDVRSAIEGLTKQGAKGFILDVRDNPGGLLDQAVQVASLFVPSGVIVRVDERNKPEQSSRATGRTATGAPLVLLVNENSASASEILAGALQDYSRATLVGVKTFGKGSVQTVHELEDGSAVKFTIAHYLTPKSRIIDGKGVTPEYVVPMKLELEYDSHAQKDVAKDTQLTKAIAVLKKEL